MQWRAALLALVMTPAIAAPVTLPARAVNYLAEGRAWAQVVSLAPVVLRATVAARVAKVLVGPGQAVATGQPLVSLGGPILEGKLTAARARWQAAQNEFAAAQRTAASAERTYPAVTDRSTLDAAEAALAAAQGDAAAARTALETLQAQQTLSSPGPAVVDTVNAVAGADVPAGTPIVSLLTHDSLWLRAEVFGDVSLPAATTARFVPADGGPAVQVHRVAELPARAPDGARVLDFAAAGAAPWQAGETGELLWQASPRRAVVVPSQALVLNAGHWYVLVDVHGKVSAQAVTPGPARGTDVLITHGLRAGVPVVVRQAYALFHRDFSAQYAPPD